MAGVVGVERVVVMKCVIWLFCIVVIAPCWLMGNLDSRIGLIQNFDTETLITNYSERLTYGDLAADAEPLTIFKFHVPDDAVDPGTIRPLMFLIDILYIADVHDVVTDELIETGIGKIKLLFFINDGDFYCTMRYKTDFTFDQAGGTFVGRSIVRYLEPVFDHDSRLLSFRIQNSSGVDAFDGVQFTPKGILRHQVAFIKHNHNAPTELHFSGDVTLNNKVIISPAKHLFFDGDTILDARYNMFHFARTKEALMSIAEGATVETHNIILKDFSPQHIIYGAQSSLIFGDGTTVELGQNEELNDTWLFKGTCILNGKGQSLTLGASGKIVVDGSSSSLLFDNITLKGVASNNICCLDNSCTLSFRCSSLVLSNDFVFEQGKFVVIDTLKVGGQKKISYLTDQQSVILADSCLWLDRRAHFEYKPIIADKMLLSLVDKSSLLHLSGATLSVSTTGLDISRGTLIVENKCFLHNEGAYSLSEGLIIGEIDIFAGASLTIESGILDYRPSLV